MKPQKATGTGSGHPRGKVLQNTPEILRFAPSEGDPTAAPQVSRKTIAILDNEPNMTELLGNMLAAEGYEVLACADKGIFLKKMRGLSVDLVISDIKSPGVDGFQFLEAIRKSKKWAKLPVIIASGMGGSSESDAMARGASEVFHKPYSIDDLLAAIRRRLKP